MLEIKVWNLFHNEVAMGKGRDLAVTTFANDLMVLSRPAICLASAQDMMIGHKVQICAIVLNCFECS